MYVRLQFYHKSPVYAIHSPVLRQCSDSARKEIFRLTAQPRTHRNVHFLTVSEYEANTFLLQGSKHMRFTCSGEYEGCERQAKRRFVISPVGSLDVRV